MKIRRRQRSPLLAVRLAARLRSRAALDSMEQQRLNEDTSRVIQAKLAQLNAKDYVVLGLEPSDSGHGNYEIRMSSAHAVYCNCKGWQFSKTGTCKHLERWKAKMRKAFGPK